MSAQVQAVGNNNGAGATTCTFTLSSTAAGSLLVLGLWCGATANISSVADDQSQTWTAVETGHTGLRMFYFQNSAAAVTLVTVTFSTSTFGTGICSEWSAMATTGALDTYAVFNGTGASTTWATATTGSSSGNERVFILWFTGDTSAELTIAEDSGTFTNLSGTGITGGQHRNTGEGDSVWMASKAVTSGGPFSYTGTQNGSYATGTMVGVFEEGEQPPPPRIIVPMRSVSMR